MLQVLLLWLVAEHRCLHLWLINVTFVAAWKDMNIDGSEQKRHLMNADSVTIFVMQTRTWLFVVSRWTTCRKLFLWMEWHEVENDFDWISVQMSSCPLCPEEVTCSRCSIVFERCVIVGKMACDVLRPCYAAFELGWHCRLLIYTVSNGSVW